MARYWPTWLAVGPLLLWALVRLLDLDGATFMAPLMAFTPIAAPAAFLVAGVCLAFRNWAAALAAGVAFLAFGTAVLPRAFGNGEDVPPGAARISVLSANLYYGLADPAHLIGLAGRRRPDLLVVQELTPRLAGELRQHGIGRLFPEALISLPEHGFGRAVYSRVPLRHLAKPSEDRPSAMPPIAATLPTGQVIRLVNVHPHPPKPSRVTEWGQALGRLPTAGSGPPWLLVGDFNATLDQSAFQDVLARGYRDAGATTGNGLVPTWPSNKAIPPLITIDHVLADRRLGIAEYGVEKLAGSDHRAIAATVFLRQPPSCRPQPSDCR